MWHLLVRKPSQMRTLQPSCSGKGLLCHKGGFTLFRFFVITRIPFFPNQFSNFSMKKDPEKLWTKCRLSFCRFQHWTSLSHLLACQLQETRGLGRLQKLFGPLTKALADNPSWAGHFLACTLQGGQSNQPPRNPLSCHFCHPVVLQLPLGLPRTPF